MVKDVSYYSKKIVIDQPTQDSLTGTPTLSFTNYGPYPYNPSPPTPSVCAHDFGTLMIPCSVVLLSAAPHVNAGYSLGGVGAGYTATCLMGGGPGDTSTLGVIGGDIFCFDHRTQFNAASLGPFICHGCAFDSKAPLFDIQQIGVLFGRGTDPLALTGTPAAGGVNTILLNSLPFDPVKAGWNKGDTLLSASGNINGQTIASIPPGGPTYSVTLNGTAVPHPAETIYDVKPTSTSMTPALTGHTSVGSTVITSLSADPTAIWSVGDILVAPQFNDIPPGARIVSISPTGTGCPCVTLDTAAVGSHPHTNLGDTTVSAVGTRGSDFVGSVLGGGGGFVFDSNANGCNSVQGAKVDVNNQGQPALEVVQGCALLTNVNASQPNDFMIDAGATDRSTLMSSSRATNSGIYFEGATALSSFVGAGNVFGTGGISNTMVFGDTKTALPPANYYNCPTQSVTVLVVFCGGDGLYGTAGGNAFENCNQRYQSQATLLIGCMGILLDPSGNWKQFNSANNPVYEFKDKTNAILPVPYQDGIQAVTSPVFPLTAAISVVSRCLHSGCASDGVQLPGSSGWIDAGSWAGTPCAPPATGNCGVGGGITIVNASGSQILVIGLGSETVNGGASTTINASLSKTFYPVSGVGWSSSN